MAEIPMATYKNEGSKQVTFKIGKGPTNPPDVYDVAPGDTCEGPASYADYFKRKGLTLVADTPAPAPMPDPPATDPVDTMFDDSEVTPVETPEKPKKKKKKKKDE